jgi:murein L,D-transpeptidase YafK
MQLRHLTLVSLLCFVTGAGAEDAVPAYILRLPPSIGAVFVADTSASAFHRFRNDRGELVHVDEHYMSIGQNGTGKQRAWDRRTPLGIYFISDELDTAKLHTKYGDLAFPLDYPSPLDRLNERSGDGIWLHGVDDRDGKRPPRDTDGCLALPNENLAAISGDLMPLTTPVIITSEMRWATGDEVAELDSVGDKVVALLDAWAQSYRSGDLHRYFGLYAEDFSYRGMDYAQWLAYRTQTIGSRTLDEIAIEELIVLADPEDENLILSRFRQTIVRGEQRVTTMKRLYWRRDADGRFRIVAEDNG